MRFDVITLFPEMFRAMESGVTGKALDGHQAELRLWNPRDFTADVHRTVDDRPYGGGPGMVMRVEPLRQAVQAAKQAAPQSRVIYLTPQGQRFDQLAAREMSQRSGLILVAGRYEGIDERLVDCCVDEEWSIGDYVLSGGELAAMVIMDAVTRLLPGVLGHEESAVRDSYMNGLLDFPQYTRPDELAGQKVPDVLLSGDHQAIERWRMQQALGRTWIRRPDLLRQRLLSLEEQRLLEEFIRTHQGASASSSDED